MIALLYILGTSSILAYVSPDAIDVIGPIPQALKASLGGVGIASILVPVVILLLLTNYLCSYTLYFSTNTRLPLVAGWDRLLPRWFTVLHPKYRTPVNSTLFMGGIALAASAAVLIGAGNQEAFVLLQIWSRSFYGLGVPRHVRDSAFRGETERHSISGVAESIIRIRIAGYAALRLSFGSTHRRSGQQVGILAENRRGGGGCESGGLGNLSCGTDKKRT